uniref:Ig-like domain-containing protein n=1 Tax=Ascaris lumbricoides TaxID=6252 RepID=A0A0M3ITS3_ASCLU
MECRVKSTSRPTAIWYKDGVPIREGALFSVVFTDLGDSQYLCQLEIHGPSAEDAGQYRCNIKNDEGETNANLALNFEQETEERHEKSPGRKSPRERREKDSASPRPGSRPGTPKRQMKSREGTPKKSLKSREGTPRKSIRTPKRQMKSREGTPKKSLKSREGTPRKSIRSRTATPTQEIEKGTADEAEVKTHKASKMQKLDAEGDESQVKAKKVAKIEKSEPEEPEGGTKGKPPSGKIEKTEIDGIESKVQKRAEKPEVEAPEAKTRKTSAMIEKSEPEQPEPIAEDRGKLEQMEVDSQSIKRKGETTLPPPEEKKARQKSASPPKTAFGADGVFEKHTTEKAAANYKRPPVVLEPAKSKVFSTLIILSNLSIATILLQDGWEIR